MLDTLRAEVQVPRSAWGGGPRPRPLTAVAVHPYIEVHHDVYDAGLSPKEHAKRIEAQHTGQGWNGAFYNLGLARDGGVWELRGVGWRSIGDHATYYADGTRVDPRALTVVLFGNYEHVDVTGAQRATLERLRRRMPDPRLRWHQMRASTACPGSRTIPVLRAINDGGTTAPEEDEDDMFTDGDRETLERIQNVLWAKRATVSGDLREHDLATPILEGRHLIGLLPRDRPVSAAEVVAAGQTVLDGIRKELAELTVDGHPTDAESIRQFLLDLLDGEA